MKTIAPLMALACACALTSQTKAIELPYVNVEFIQDNWHYQWNAQQYFDVPTAGWWYIDGIEIGYGGGIGNDFYLPLNYASNFRLSAGEHFVTFKIDDGSGVILTGTQPYVITDPVGERPLEVPDAGNTAAMLAAGLGLLSLACFRRK